MKNRNLFERSDQISHIIFHNIVCTSAWKTVESIALASSLIDRSVSCDEGMRICLIRNFQISHTWRSKSNKCHFWNHWLEEARVCSLTTCSSNTFNILFEVWTNFLFVRKYPNRLLIVKVGANSSDHSWRYFWKFFRTAVLGSQPVTLPVALNSRIASLAFFGQISKMWSCFKRCWAEKFRLFFWLFSA